jgi:hypothetical protein
MITPEKIKMRQQAQKEALKQKLLTAFEAARKTVLAPILYSDDVAINKAHKERAEKTYGTLIDQALSDLRTDNFIADSTLERLESALNTFPVKAIQEMEKKTENKHDVNRKYLQIFHQRFNQAVKGLVADAKALSPSSKQAHRPRGMTHQQLPLHGHK